MRIGFVWPAANLSMFGRIDFKSVFKALSFSTDIQFSTDLAPNQRANVAKATKMITDVDVDIQAAVRGNTGT